MLRWRKSAEWKHVYKTCVQKPTMQDVLTVNVLMEVLFFECSALSGVNETNDS